MKEIVNPDGHVKAKDDEDDISENENEIKTSRELSPESSPKQTKSKSKKKYEDTRAWRKHHEEAIDKTDPNLYPKLWELSGLRGKVSLTPFISHIQDAHTIFDSNRRINFRNVSHVYHMAFYLGMEDLKYQYLTKKKIPFSPMSRLFMETEQQRREEDEIGLAVEEIKDYYERLKKKWISEEEYEKKEAKLVSNFTDPVLKRKVENAIEGLFADGEDIKVTNRLTMREWREKIKASRIRLVK
jgi:hypothetical protein